MSSTETLTFGPQWLRELSGGADKSNSNPPISLPPSRFKLAKYRYGREEMLALFLDEEVIPEDLYRVPYVVVEGTQRPLALTPMNDNFQPNVSDGRGMTSNSFHEHTGVGRGRGRGNLRSGDSFVGHMEPVRRPDKKDWRSISEQPGGKGDGVEDIFSDIQDWRSGFHRNDMARDPWYDRNTDGRNSKQFRNRSLSAKEKSTPMFLPWPDRSPDEALSSERNQESSQNTSKLKKDCDESDIDFSIPEEKIETLVDKEDSVEVEKVALTGLNEKLEGMKEEPNKTIGFPVHTSDPPTIATVIAKNEVIQDSSHLVLDLPREDTNDIFLHESVPIAVTSGLNLVQSNPPQLIPQVNPIAQLQILATTWFYKDPQGKTQGPFNSGQMMDWFRAGYFARELLVKRACDVDFVQLGNLMESCGGVPFKQYEIGPSHMITEQYHSDIARQTFVDQQRLLQEQYLLSQHGHFKWPQQEHSVVHQNFAEITRNNEFLERTPQHTSLLLQNSLEYGNVMNYGPHNHTVKNLNEPSPVDHLKNSHFVEALHVQSDDLISPSLEPQEIQSNLKLPEARVLQHSLDHEAVESKGMQFIEVSSQQMENTFEQNKPSLINIVVEQATKIDVEEIPQKEHSKSQEKSARKGKDGKMTKQESRKKREDTKQQKNSKENKQMKNEEKHTNERKKTTDENPNQKKEVKSNKDARNKVKMPKGGNQQKETSPIAVIKERNVPAPSENIEQPNDVIPVNAYREKPKSRQEPITVSLPPTVSWAQNQLLEGKQRCLSLFEIQQMEEKTEQIQREQMRKLVAAKQQEKAQQVGWAQKVTEKPNPKSFWEIQREEQMKNQGSHQSVNRNVIGNVENKHATIATSNHSASFWDQVVEENKPPQKPTPSRMVQKVEKQKQTVIPGQTRTAKKTNEEKQTQRLPKDIVIEHCENYLRRINAEHIDIPTFVNFLYDVESPDEVQEYVTSYLGESGGAKEFSKIFLEMRSKSCSLSNESTIIQISSQKSREPVEDNDGFKLVKVNAKHSKNKRRQRKLQKADPSLLGFSVNAASDRVNMGEIHTTNDH